MRRVLPLLLAALVACQVDVEGAPCRTGHAEDCPSGQGCGDDLRCSASGCKCRDGLVCGTASSAPSCVCPPNPGPEFAADPAGSRALDPPYPTGVESPVVCRFGRLGDALEAASAHAAAHPETIPVARAYGEAPVTFGVAEGETFPLEIAPGVVLSRAAAGAADPAGWIIRADTSSSADIVRLHEGARIEGFTIASVSAAGNVVQLSCQARTKTTLSRVVVDGGRVAARGLNVVGPCDVEATDLAISGAAGPGLFVKIELSNAKEPVSGVTISAGSISDNGGSGAEVYSGVLSLTGAPERPFEIARNAVHGVFAKGSPSSPAAIAVALDAVEIKDNAGTGLFLRDLTDGSQATFRSTDVHENKAMTEASVYYDPRRAGGIVLWGGKIPVVFDGNRVWGNLYDQVGILSSDAWNLSGGDNCGAKANVFACPDADAARSGKLVYAASGVDQQFSDAYWSEFPPSTMTVGVSYQPICGPNPAKLPLCPSSNQ